eukprot:scaffold2626_cov159-Cylindrotheca_fusiformis.AAC.2
MLDEPAMHFDGTTSHLQSSYQSFLFLGRQNHRVGIKKNFAFLRFGLTVHCGDKRSSKPESKTEAMFIPGYGRQPTPNDTEDIMLNEHEFFGFCDSLKYFGTTFDNTLDDSIDVKKRRMQTEHSQQWRRYSRMEKSLQSSDLGHTKQQYSAYFYLGAKVGPETNGQTEIGILSPQMPKSHGEHHNV